MHEGSHHGTPLRPSEFENHLSVLAVERRFYREVVGIVLCAERPDFFMDALQLGVGIGDFSKIQHAHVHEMRLAGRIYTDDPETKEIGSGIDSEYGT